MSFRDKVKHKAEELAGAGKKAAGDATDDEKLAAEGRSEQSEAKVKQAGDKAKDAAGDVKDAFDK